MGAAVVKAVTKPAQTRRLHLRTRSAIGLDVGARSVKAIQFARDRFGDGGWRVAAAAEMPRESAPQEAAAGQPAGPPVAPTKAGPLAPAEVARLVATLERQGFAGADVVLAAPNDRVYTSMLELPPRSSNAPLDPKSITRRATPAVPARQIGVDECLDVSPHRNQYSGHL